MEHPKTAPVRGDYELRPPGTVEWSEHLRAWAAYAAEYGDHHSAEHFAADGGFSYDQLEELLGHVPKTWEPDLAAIENEIDLDPTAKALIARIRQLERDFIIYVYEKAQLEHELLEPRD